MPLSTHGRIERKKLQWYTWLLGRSAIHQGLKFLKDPGTRQRDKTLGIFIYIFSISNIYSLVN